MATDAEILSALRQNAADGVSSASFGPGTSTTSGMSVRDQIEAYRFSKEISAQSRNHGGIFFKQIQPCGAVNDE